MFKFSVSALAAASLFSATALAQEVPSLSPDLKINEIQVLGTHNSYSAGVDPRILALLQSKVPGKMGDFVKSVPEKDRALFLEEHPNNVTLTEGLNYRHPDILTQLELGVRSLEIDINPDPKGGNFLNPVGYKILRDQGVTDLLPQDTTDLEKPGFKVLHIADIDFRSQCPTLKACLLEIKSWSNAHPKHVPLFIMIEAKVQDIPILPGATHTKPFDAQAFNDLDQEILSTLGRDKLITPDDVRGDYPTLNAAVLAKHWPTLEQARGKILIFMTTATGPTGATGYLQGHPSLRGRPAFLRAEPGQDYSAVLLYDNAKARAEDIAKYVRQGYLVRTRSDIESYEAKVNDLSRAKAAFDSGAQVVSTDFEHPGNAYGTDYVVRLPGGEAARCNTVAKPDCPR